jgi:ABC-type sulfate/molybdate transport systems ATPase subunit
VYQDFRLFDWMSVFDNVAFGCRAQGWNRARIDCRVHDVLEGIGLGNAIARPVIELSGGERQRVAIARAFACEPHGLLLDEPFSDLDPPLRRRLRADLLRWLADNPTPAILVTHDRWEAFELCDRIGFLSEGRLHQEGAPEELYDHPATPTVAEFMGCDNCLAGSVESSDPPFVCVRTPAGVLSAREMRSPAVPGTPVQLRCRPQSAGLLSHESPAENRLRVTCATIHQVEDHRVATLVLENGALWTARWPGEIEVEPGGEITIVIPPTELLAYPDAPW